MNRVILVGNGFDKHVGLNTDYPSLLSKVLANMIKGLNPLGENILMKVNEDIKLPYRKKTDAFFKELLELIKDNKIEIKSKFLNELLESFRKNENWCNYETIMYKTYLDDYNMYKISHDKSIAQSLKKRQLNEKISLETAMKCSYLTSDSYRYLRDCITEIDNRIIDEIKTENNRKNNIKDYIERVNKIVNILNSNEDIDKTLICNFNYTDTFEDVTKQIEHEDLLYIHGSLKENNCRFGYYILDTFFREGTFKKYCNREEWEEEEPSHSNYKDIMFIEKSRLTSEYYDLHKFISLDRFELFIIGQSCGESDRLLLQKGIFKSKNCHSVTVMKYNESSYNDIEKNIRTKCDFYGEIKPINYPK